MIRRALVMSAVLYAPLALSQNDWSKVEIKVTPVAGKVFMLEGAGGNIGVSAGDDGILIVDDQFGPLAPKIKAALKGLVDKPVRFVLNTHHHGDHTSGNPAFAADGAEIIAHDNVRTRITAQRNDPNSPVSKQPVSVLPVLTFKDSLTVHFNGEEIRALHLPNGHTDGDAMIYFVGSKVVHLGDQFFNGTFPFVDQSSGGTVKGVIANLERVIREVPADTRFIPGHGPLGTLADLKAHLAMLKETRAVVAAGIKKGKSLDQLLKEKVLAKWDKLATDFVSTDIWVETLYDDVKAK